MEQREYWNEAAAGKNFTTPFQAAEFGRYVGKNDSILDVGYGYGRTLDELYHQGFTNLSGIDFSAEMIRRGHVQFPYLDLNVMESSDIDRDDCSVDAVILFAVLTCIADNDAQRHLISEIRRVLKPDGILYINDFLLNTDERNLTRYQKFEEKYHTYGVFELAEGAVCRHHSEEWIHELLKDYHEECFEHLTFTTMNGHRSNGFYYIGRRK